MALVKCNSCFFPLKILCPLSNRTFIVQFINLCLKPHVFYAKLKKKTSISQVSEDEDVSI